MKKIDEAVGKPNLDYNSVIVYEQIVDRNGT